MASVQGAWDYLWEAVRTHPFNFFTLLFALTAGIISFIATRHRKALADAAKTAACEAEKIREGNERAMGLQAQALETQALALQSQQADTAKALEVAGRSADAATKGAEAAVLSANTAKLAL